MAVKPQTQQLSTHKATATHTRAEDLTEWETESLLLHLTCRASIHSLSLDKNNGNSS